MNLHVSAKNTWRQTHFLGWSGENWYKTQMRKTEGRAKSKDGWTQLTQSKYFPVNATGELDAEVMMVTEWGYSLLCCC